MTKTLDQLEKELKIAQDNYNLAYQEQCESVVRQQAAKLIGKVFLHRNGEHFELRHFLDRLANDRLSCRYVSFGVWSFRLDATERDPDDFARSVARGIHTENVYNYQPSIPQTLEVFNEIWSSADKVTHNFTGTFKLNLNLTEKTL